MKNLIINRITPQAKNINVNNKFGNRGIKQQQGTTVTKYDTLPLDGRTTLNFFQDANSRNFPYSNCGSDGNKLGVGNTLVVERIYFTLLAKDPNNFNNLETYSSGLIINAPLGLSAIQYAELTFNIANSNVLKNFPLMSTISDFNYSTQNEVDNVYNLDTNIVIPPLLEYVGIVRIPNYQAPSEGEFFLRMTIEGSGSIIAPRTTF